MTTIDLSADVFSYVEPTADEMWTTSIIVCSADGAVMFNRNVVRLPVVVIGLVVGMPPATFGPVRYHRTVYVTAHVGPPSTVRLYALTSPGASVLAPSILPKIGPCAAAGARKSTRPAARIARAIEMDRRVVIASAASGRGRPRRPQSHRRRPRPVAGSAAPPA